MIPRDSDLFKWSEYYLKLGFSVVPLREGKLPAVAWKEFQSRRADRLELMKWFVDSGWGMAIVCGKVSGNLVRIDFDDPKDYEALKSKIPAEAPVFKSQRQGGGYGVLMLADEPIPTLPQKTFKNRPKVEVRGEGSITVVPPTPGYKWLRLKQVPKLDVKQWLKEVLDFDLANRDTLASSVGASADTELDKLLRETEAGERSNNLVKIAGMLRARGIDIDTATQVMQINFEEHWPHGGMDWTEAEITFRNAYKRYQHEGVRVTGKRSGMVDLDDDEDDEDIIVWDLQHMKPNAEDAVLIDRLVLRGKDGNTIIGAEAKRGKTSTMLDACITASRGDPVWFTLNVPRPVRIAYIDQEQKTYQIRENMELMFPVIGEPNWDNFKMITQQSGQFQVDRKKTLAKLRRFLEDFKPDLVVIDGWGWFVNHRDSDPDYVRPAMAWVKALRVELNCATIIIHHYKKVQYASGREVSEIDSLDRIAGMKRLVDQAHTALGYGTVPGYDTFNMFNGRTNKPSWDPPKIVIDYDHTTLTHRALTAEEGQDLFDPDTYRELWGKESNESRRVKGMMNVIRNRMGGAEGVMTQVELAAALGVDKAQVSRWYSGRQSPGGASMDKLNELYKKAKDMPLKRARMPKRRN